MSAAIPLWVLTFFMLAIVLVLILVGAPGNAIGALLMLGCPVVIATVIVAGLESSP